VNRAEGPGFRWTVLVTPGEVEGLDWIKNGTFKSARVQVEPVERGRDTWAYIPAFAERRMASGLPLSMIPLAKYEKANEEIRKLYLSTSADAVYEAAARHCIDTPDRSARAEQHPQLEPLLDAHKSQFVPAFKNGTLTVYTTCRATVDSPGAGDHLFLVEAPLQRIVEVHATTRSCASTARSGSRSCGCGSSTRSGSTCRHRARCWTSGAGSASSRCTSRCRIRASGSAGST
jgi:hypothetical protein